MVVHITLRKIEVLRSGVERAGQGRPIEQIGLYYSDKSK